MDFIATPPRHPNDQTESSGQDANGKPAFLNRQAEKAISS